MRTINLTLLLASLALLSGCVTWEKGGTPHTNTELGFTVTTPDGWWFHSRLGGKPFTATRDGIGLENLVIQSYEVGKPLPNNKRNLESTATAFEIAELLSDDYMANRALSQLEVRENLPVDFGGKPGFKLVLEYTNQDKLRITEIIHGALAEKRLLLLVYTGPTRHFMPRDRAAVDAVANSFRFKS